MASTPTYSFCRVNALFAAAVPPHNKQLQRTVMDKVPRHVRERAAAELRRYAAVAVHGQP
jgi:hypothetical protein